MSPKKKQSTNNPKPKKQHDPLGGGPVVRGPMRLSDLTRQIDVAEGRLRIVQEIIMELERKAKELQVEVEGCNDAIARLEAKPAKKK